VGNVPHTASLLNLTYSEVIILSRLLCLLLFTCVLALTATAQQTTSTPPAVGDKAPDFTLSTQQGKRVRLADVTAQAPVVLVVLRGYPGYQCPLCNLQVQDFLKNAQGFAEAKTRVILVYPGPPENLNARAAEFFTDKPLPAHFELLLDPGYEFTNRYGLRWDAPKETAYPSIFLIDQKGIVFYAKVSKTHGGRAKAAEILEALVKKKAG
jgi:thioredoxin-dependent peroxiredoxin